MQAMVRIVNSGVYFATLMTALSACSEAAQSVAQPDAAVDPKKDAQGSPTSCDFEISDNEGLAGPAMEMRQRLDLHLRSVDGNACLKMARVAKCRETICKQWDFDVLRTVMVAGGTTRYRARLVCWKCRTGSRRFGCTLGMVAVAHYVVGNRACASDTPIPMVS